MRARSGGGRRSGDGRAREGAREAEDRHCDRLPAKGVSGFCVMIRARKERVQHLGRQPAGSGRQDGPARGER